MSFAHDVKTELCSLRPERECCRRASLYGLLLFARVFGAGEISLQTEHAAVADHARQLVFELYGLMPELKKKASGVSILSLAGRDARAVYEDFGYGDRTVSLRLNRANIENECCPAAFLRGAFESCGSVVDPGKDYHLEFSAPHRNLCRDLADFLREQGLKPKTAARKGSFLVYFKESEQIEDILTLMGATRQSLRIMNVKVYKDLRNKANRVTNCETANIDKTVNASTEQVEAIRKILRLKGQDGLPDDLKELALLRLKNPELSLRELGGMLRVTLSRSGVNHRLQKIMDIADRLG